MVKFHWAVKLDTGVPSESSLALAFWTSMILSAELSTPFGVDLFPNTFLNRPLNLFLKIKQTNAWVYVHPDTFRESKLWPFLHRRIASIRTQLPSKASLQQIQKFKYNSINVCLLWQCLIVCCRSYTKYDLVLINMTSCPCFLLLWLQDVGFLLFFL